MDMLRYFINKNKAEGADDKASMHRFVDGLEQIITELSKQKTLTYEEVMKYFYTAAPSNMKTKRGLLLREATADRIHIIQVFLDEKDEIITKPGRKNTPIGRRVVVHTLDTELEELFGNVDLVIVE